MFEAMVKTRWYIEVLKDETLHQDNQLFKPFGYYQPFQYFFSTLRILWLENGLQ